MNVMGLHRYLMYISKPLGSFGPLASKQLPHCLPSCPSCLCGFRLAAHKIKGATRGQVPVVAPLILRTLVCLSAFQFPFDRVADQFIAVLEVELGLDVFAVCFDGLGAQVQSLGYLTRAQALTDQLEHLQLTIG